MTNNESNMAKELESLRAENEQLQKNVSHWMGQTFSENKAKIQAKIDRSEMEKWGLDQLDFAEKARAQLAEAREVIEWYANWDWSDKYVQAVPKRASIYLEKYK